MRRPVTHLGRLDQQLLLLDREILELERNQRTLQSFPPMNASVSVRRMERGQLIARQLAELRPMRAELLAEMQAEELATC